MLTGNSRCRLSNARRNPPVAPSPDEKPPSEPGGSEPRRLPRARGSARASNRSRAEPPHDRSTLVAAFDDVWKAVQDSGSATAKMDKPEQCASLSLSASLRWLLSRSATAVACGMMRCFISHEPLRISGCLDFAQSGTALSASLSQSALGGRGAVSRAAVTELSLQAPVTGRSRR